MNEQILETPDTMRILNPYRYGGLDAYITSLSPRAWYAARKETAYADTDLVPTITDWSGVGNHATQAAGGNQAAYSINGFNGKPTFVFAGADFYLRADIITNINAVTALIVCNGGDSNDIGISLSTAGNAYYLPWCQVSGNVDFRYGGTNITMTTRPFGDSLFTSDGTANCWLNGTNKGSTAPISGYTSYVNILGFSAAYGWNGDIAEAIVFNRNLSATERQTLENLLGAHYGITITH